MFLQQTNYLSIFSFIYLSNLDELSSATYLCRTTRSVRDRGRKRGRPRALLLCFHLFRYGGNEARSYHITTAPTQSVAIHTQWLRCIGGSVPPVADCEAALLSSSSRGRRLVRNERMERVSFSCGYSSWW